jgi:hypothetical protein
VGGLEAIPHHVDFDSPEEEELAPATHEHIVATDASTTGLGWCWFRKGQAVQEHTCGGERVAVKAHIFFLELEAAIKGLRAWCSEIDQQAEKRGKPAKATLVVDNAALAFALRHGFSSNMKANQMMGDARHVLNRIEDVILVISEDNPADCCSRRFEGGRKDHHASFDGRVERMLRCIDCRIHGWNWASGKAADYVFQGLESVRHPEGIADETGMCMDEAMVM